MFTKSSILLVLFTVLLTVGYAKAQQNPMEGKSFWVSCIPNGKPNPSIDLVISSSTNAIVKIENTAKGFSQSYLISANNPLTVTVPSAFCVPPKNNQIDNYALHITSSALISVYTFNNASKSADGMLVLPEEVCGTLYSVATFTPDTGLHFSSFIVVALEDNTTIKITPSFNTLAGQFPWVPYLVVLNKGETYLEYGDVRVDLIGSTVESVNKKKIAVFGGVDASKIPDQCSDRDVLMEQMVPTNTLGRKYITTPLIASSSTPNYGYRILSIQDSNDIYVNGSYVYTLLKGYSKYFLSQKAPLHIESIKPIMVIQYMESGACAGGGVGDPSMVIIPPLEQFVKSANYATSNFSEFLEHHISVTVKTTAKSSLYINGVNVPASKFIPVDSFPLFSYANLDVTSGKSYLIESDSGFIMVGYGYGNAISYAQIGATNFRPLNYDIDIQGISCGKLQFDFNNTGDTETIVNSHWDFGDGTVGTGIRLSKTYVNHGTYTIKNIVTYADRNNDLHYDTLKRTIKTLPNPVARITPSDIDSCFEQHRFVLADKSQYPSSIKNQAVWSFSDTSLTYINTDTIQKKYKQPSITADTTIINTITLVVSNQDFCYDTARYTAAVYPSANTNFIITGNSCFNDNKLQPFPTSSIDYPGIISGYKWDFGDGTSDTTAAPTKKYSDTGKYIIRLIAIDATAACNDTARYMYVILPSPKTNFTLSDVCKGDSVIIRNTSTITQGSLTYKWDYGNGITDTAFNRNFLYTDTGVHTIKLKAVSKFLCADSITKNVTVMPNPEANFSVSKGACENNAVTFFDNTERYKVALLKNTWAFGDNNVLQSNGNSAHTYTTMGKYTAKLVTVSTNGCADSTTRNVYVNNLPTTGFVLTDTGLCLKGNQFTASSTSVVNGGGIKQLRWYLDDKITGVGSSASVSFASAGAHAIKLLVVSDSFCVDSIIKPITVYPQANLDVLINDTSQCLAGNQFTFTNISSIATGGLTYTWSLSTGDIINATDISPKSFTVPGQYSIRLISTSDKGCLDTLNKFVKVEYSPSVSFIPITVCENNSAVFFNTTSGGAGGWLWDFGDGTTSTAKDPVHFYPGAGIYRVRLIGESANGCSDTAVSDTGVVVFPAPQVYFTADVYDNIDGITKVQFINKTHYGTNYSWTFGNGNASRDNDPLEEYSDTGFFLVQLSAINNFNCYDDFDTLLHIVPDYSVFIPNAFTPNKDPLNSVFKIEGTLYYNRFAMNIYNRWGELLFTSNDPQEGWDGSYKGEPVPEGVYTYVIQIANLKDQLIDFKGDITLLR